MSTKSKKHIDTLRASPNDVITVFETYKGFSIWFDEVSMQYQTMINGTPVSSYSIVDLERNIDFYLRTKEIII